jgi:hypothetical protein
VGCFRDLADGLSKCGTVVLHFRHRKCCKNKLYNIFKDLKKDRSVCIVKIGYLHFFLLAMGPTGLPKWEIDKCRTRKTTLNYMKYKSETRFIDTVPNACRNVRSDATLCSSSDDLVVSQI